MNSPTTCPICSGQLRMRLGQLECANCGGVDQGSQFVHTSVIKQEDEFQYFSRAHNQAAKRWCFCLYVPFALIPSNFTLFCVFMLLFFTWAESTDRDTTFPGLSAFASMVAVLLAVELVLSAFALFVFHLVLFSDILWLKWVFLILSIWWTLLNLGVLFVPQLVMSQEDSAKVQELGAIGGWIVVVFSLLGAVYSVWLIRLIWPDIRGLQMNRKLARRYA